MLTCVNCGTPLVPIGITRAETKDSLIVIYRQYYCRTCGNIVNVKEEQRYD